MSAVGSISPAVQAPQLVNKPEAMEAPRVGPDHDGDADDRASAASAAKAPAPVVNTSGQTTGLIVNTKA